MDYKYEYYQHGMNSLKPETRKEYYDKLIRLLSQQENLHTDVFNLKKDELEKVLNKIFFDSSPASIRSERSIIKNYINWSEINNYRTERYDYKDVIYKTTDKLLKYSLQEKARRMVSRKEVYNIEDIDPQIHVASLLLFEGIDGSKHSEIINLKTNDYNIVDKKIVLENDRTLSIPSKLIEILNKATNPEYLKRYNGRYKTKNEVPYLESEYVLRKIRQGNTESGNIDSQNIPKKVSELKKYINKEVNPDIIKDSGLCYYLYVLENIKKTQFNETLELSDYLKVAKRFNRKCKSYINICDIQVLYEEYKKHNKYKITIDDELITIYNEIMSYSVTLPKGVPGQTKESSSQIDEDLGPNVGPDTELGLEGEEVIEKYLKFKYPQSIIKNETKNNKGYDFYIIKADGSYECIEVKTSKVVQKRIQIYITTKELLTAYKRADSYSLYFLYIKNKIPVALYILNNPIKLLGLTKEVQALSQSPSDKKCYLLAIQSILNLDFNIVKSHVDNGFTVYVAMCGK